MTLENDVSEILVHLEGRRPDVWGRQAANVADGIRLSGVTDHIDAASERMQTNLLGLATVVGLSSQLISAEIARSNRFLETMASAINAPRQTGAAERFKIGLLALQRGWMEEAIEEFTESIELYKLNPSAHAALGVTLSSDGKLSEAKTALLFGERYAAPDNQALAAGCALQAAQLMIDLQEYDEALRTLERSSSLYPQCPELALALARVSGDSGPVREALRIAPDLFPIAMASQVPGVEEAADDLAHSDDGHVALVKSLEPSLKKIMGLLPEIGWPAELNRFHELGSTTSLDDIVSAATILHNAAGFIDNLEQAVERALAIRAAALDEDRAITARADADLEALRAEQSTLIARQLKLPGDWSSIQRDLDLVPTPEYRKAKQRQAEGALLAQIREHQEKADQIPMTGPVPGSGMTVAEWSNLLYVLRSLKLRLERLPAVQATELANDAGERNTLTASRIAIEGVQERTTEKLAQVEAELSSISQLHHGGLVLLESRNQEAGITQGSLRRRLSELRRIVNERPARLHPWVGA